jgi:chromosome segregation ATPase
MIELAMLFGAGFLTAAVLGMFVANAVWRRAVRLTTKRIQAAMPVSLADIKADRDQLRAEFALSTRKLEMAVDDLKKRTQVQLVDIGKKNEQIRILIEEVKTRSEQQRQFEGREQELRAIILTTESQLGTTMRDLRSAEKAVEKATESLALRERELADTKASSDERRVELAALQTNLARVEDELGEVRRVRDRIESERQSALTSLAEAEANHANARAGASAAQAKLMAGEETVRLQADELGKLQARVMEQAAAITAGVVNANETATRVQALIDERDRLESDMARRVGEAETRSSSLLDELERLRSERAVFEGQLKAAREDRDKALSGARLLEGAAQENWERERVDNALLRERMNDLAAEIVAMTAQLEGGQSKINLMIEEADAAAHAPVGGLPRIDAELSRTTTADMPTTLAGRVKALQSRAARAK